MKQNKPFPRLEVGSIKCAAEGCDWKRGFMLVVTGDEAKDAPERDREAKSLTRASRDHQRKAHGVRGQPRMLMLPKGAKAPKGWRRLPKSKKGETR